MGKKTHRTGRPRKCPEKDCISRDDDCEHLEKGFNTESCPHYMTAEILNQATIQIEAEKNKPAGPTIDPVAIDRIRKIGGKTWNSPDGKRHRAYFNQPILAELYGLAVTVRDLHVYDGCVVSATVNGEPITNEGAIDILYELKFGKVWYDFDKKEFNYQGNGNVLSVICEKLKGLLSQGQVEKALETT